MPLWVFFDVGNVLLNEGPLTYFVFRRHVEAVQSVRPDLTFLDLLAEREARAGAGSRWPVFDVISSYLDESRCAEVWEETAQAVRARFAELSPMIPGALAMVQRLAKHHRLGLIANQGPECRAWLDRLRLLAHFEVVALSEERGLFKPDPKLFAWALEQAGTVAEECLMVGDRLDNDIAPASALGFRTAWVRCASRSWQPPDPDGRAYRASLERSAQRAAVNQAQIRPDLTVEGVLLLERALQSHRINHPRSRGNLSEFRDL